MNTTIQEPGEYENYQKLLMAITMTALSMLTIVGNLLVFYVYYKTKSLQVPTNFYLLSLAVADLLVGIFSINFYTVYLVNASWPLGHLLCTLWLCLDYWVSQASVVSLIAISVDRMLLLTYPIKYKGKRTAYVVKMSIAAIWVFTFLEWIPIILYFQLMKERKPDSCEANFLVQNEHVTIISAMVAYYIPIIILASLCIKIYSLLKHRKIKMKGFEVNDPLDSSSSSAVHIEQKIELTQSKEVIFKMDVMQSRPKGYIRDHRRATKLLILIAIAYGITWLPYHVQAVMKPFVEDIPTWSWHFGYIFCYVNSLVNPPCYAFGNRSFLKKLKQLIPFLKKRK